MFRTAVCRSRSRASREESPGDLRRPGGCSTGCRLAAHLVVLSACQTGLGSGALADVPAGDDWVGLTRAFLHAGAANVVATLWAVDDWATAALMERFYEGYASDGDSERALAGAQRALLAAPATSHPFYWAGFVITEAGDGKGVVR